MNQDSFVGNQRLTRITGELGLGDIPDEYIRFNVVRESKRLPYRSPANRGIIIETLPARVTLNPSQTFVADFNLSSRGIKLDEPGGTYSVQAKLLFHKRSEDEFYATSSKVEFAISPESTDKDYVDFAKNCLSHNGNRHLLGQARSDTRLEFLDSMMHKQGTRRNRAPVVIRHRLIWFAEKYRNAFDKYKEQPLTKYLAFYLARYNLSQGRKEDALKQMLWVVDQEEFVLTDDAMLAIAVTRRLKGEQHEALALLNRIERKYPDGNCLWLARELEEAWAQNLTNHMGMVFVRVKAGEFMMGADETDELSGNDSKPRHRVVLSQDYLIGKHEVTVAQFEAFIKKTDYAGAARKGGALVYLDRHFTHSATASWKDPGFSQSETHPVVCVNWNDAQAFCGWLNEADKSKPAGWTYRLPTEAEWEYAARGGNLIYPWGNKWCPTNCNYDSTQGNIYSWPDMKLQAGHDDGFEYTSPVGKFSPAGDSQFGLCDMAGNVKEWCRKRAAQASTREAG